MKSISWLVIVVQLMLPLAILSGCAEKETTAAQPPDDPSLTPEVQAQLEQGERYEYWIGQMDPFSRPWRMVPTSSTGSGS